MVYVTTLSEADTSVEPTVIFETGAGSTITESVLDLAPTKCDCDSGIVVSYGVVLLQAVEKKHSPISVI